MKVDLSGVLSGELDRIRKEYEEAKSAGDMDLARQKARNVADLLRQMAQSTPARQTYFNKIAVKWEAIAEGRPVPHPATSGYTATESSGDSVDEEEGFRNKADSLITKSDVTWNDIGGLERVKRLMMETVVIAGLQKPAAIKPWKGVLLFGPPGTGKTLLASAAAGSLQATFYDVKSESVLSKYFGESSKLISALYDSARDHAPSIVFIDEFDALSQARGDNTSEATRKVLSSILTHLDGLQDKKSDRLLLTLAATNTPWELDTAVLSRFPRRIYVTLPDKDACAEIMAIHMKELDVKKLDLPVLAEECVERRYSGRDLQNLCQQAMWHMIHDKNQNLHKLAELPFADLQKRKLKVRPLQREDLDEAFDRIRSPVTKADLKRFDDWNETYGEV